MSIARHSIGRQHTTFRLIWMCHGRSAGISCLGQDTALGRPLPFLNLTGADVQVTSPSQRSLFHVLHSFSLRCQSCGYVQGMGPIAATLLCYFEPERVYAGLVLLHDTYRLHDVFNAGFPGMLEAIYVQERVMQTTMPAVYEACRKHMVSTTSYATKWYITLFANSVPFQTQLRFWDVFLLEGYDVFVAIAVAIVWVYRGAWTALAILSITKLSSLIFVDRPPHVEHGELRNHFVSAIVILCTRR